MIVKPGEGTFDLIVIGSGPGGYVAAIRAAQLGMKVACVEVDKLGGVCLNIGCIPTKALLSSALLVNEMKAGERHGIRAQGLTFDLGPAQERSRKVAEQMNKGIAGLFKKNGVTWLEGRGKLKPGLAIDICDRNDKITAQEFAILVESWRNDDVRQADAPNKEIARQRQYDAFLDEINPDAAEIQNEAYAKEKFAFMAGAADAMTLQDYIREYLLDFDSMDENQDTVLTGDELMRFRALNRGETLKM